MAGIQQVDAVLANKFFKAYMLNPHVDTLYGFTINAQQVAAMKLISENDPSVDGFRVYLGLTVSTRFAWWSAPAVPTMWPPFTAPRMRPPDHALIFAMTRARSLTGNLFPGIRE
jgi:hypothetical protein